MLYLPMSRMAPILWGALLVIRSQHHGSIDEGSAQMAVGHVGQLDGWIVVAMVVSKGAVVVVGGGRTMEGIDGESGFL